jgi:hypothetical protein
MRKFWVIRIVGIALVIAIVLAGFGNAVLYLWNTLMPAIFGLSAISYWQAVGLLCLSWIFFGSWRAFPRMSRRSEHCDRSGLRASTKEAVRAALHE